MQAIIKPSAFPRTAPTSERAWLQWAGAQSNLPWDTTFATAARVVVVSPHPDDETLACGGLIAELHARRFPVIVVAVTDGEGSHPQVSELAAIRRAEQAAALRALGHDRAPVRLGLPDGSVARHAAELRSHLLTVVTPRDVVLAPWSSDGHTDHDACGSAAEAIAERLGCALLAYPVWAWQWATPRDLGARAWQRFTLAPSAWHAKTTALECFPSQTTDHFGDVIVDPIALARFRRRFEVYSRVR